MRILFYAANIVPVHGKSLDERAVGGTETGLIRLAEALDRLGHDVVVYTPIDNPPESKPRYLPTRMIESAEPCDVFVSIRDWIPVFYKVNAALRFVWTGDSYDHYLTFGIGDKRVSRQIDALLTVSEWQSKTLSQHSRFPIEKCAKLGNGIEPTYFVGHEARSRKRLIYSSTPYRGLKHTPHYIRTLREKHPDLEFHVFSSYKVYDQSEDLQFEIVTQQLKEIPGVVLHGSVKQSELAREFMKSSILFYPNEFEETSCITAIEAMVAGCVPVTSNLAALPETIRDAGLLIEGKPGTPDYDRAFVSATDRLLSENGLWEALSQKGKARLNESTWESRAHRFLQIVSEATARKLGASAAPISSARRNP